MIRHCLAGRANANDWPRFGGAVNTNAQICSKVGGTGSTYVEDKGHSSNQGMSAGQIDRRNAGRRAQGRRPSVIKFRQSGLKMIEKVRPSKTLSRSKERIFLKNKRRMSNRRRCT
jgi:hypothetical protein